MLKKLLFAATLGLAVVEPSLAAAQTAPAPLALAPLDPFIGRLRLVSVMIEGQPARMLLDTGGGITFLTPEMAARIGCEPYGALTAFRMQGDPVISKKCGERQIGIGDYSARIDMFVFNLAELMPAGLPQVDGVLSLDAFFGQAITLDLADSLLIIESPDSLRARVGDHPPTTVRIMREAGGVGLTVFAPVRATRGSLWFLVDSANLAEPALSPGSLEQLDLDAAEIATATASGVLDRPVEVIGAGDRLERMAVRPLIYDGALNERFLSGREVTLDLGARAVWYLPNH